MRLLNSLAVGGIEGQFHSFDKLTTGRRISSRRGLGLFPGTQVLKDLFDNVCPVNEADDSHFSFTFRTDKRVGLVDLSDEVRPSFNASQ
jgi:hypothetical protein